VVTILRPVIDLQSMLKQKWIALQWHGLFCGDVTTAKFDVHFMLRDNVGLFSCDTLYSYIEC
jgi:hypothetical protein